MLGVHVCAYSTTHVDWGFARAVFNCIACAIPAFLLLQFEALKVPYPKDTTTTAIDAEEKEAVRGVLDNVCTLLCLGYLAVFW